MNSTPIIVIKLKAWIAFFTAFLVTLGASLAPYVPKTAEAPTWIGWAVILIGPWVTGFTALNAFLSTEFADHKADAAAQLASSRSPTKAYAPRASDSLGVPYGTNPPAAPVTSNDSSNPPGNT